MFVTCFYAILDPKSGRLLYANAGNDLPYLRRRNGDVDELRARGMPLGLMSGMGYEEKEIVLDAGEAALFYSDGLVEAHDSQRHEMFGFPRLRALIAEHGKERSLGEFLFRGALLLRRGRLGAGGRHHPPYAKAFRINKLNFSEHTSTHFDQ